MSAKRLSLFAFSIIAIGAGWFVYRAPIGQNGLDFTVYRTAGSAVLHGESLFGPWMGQQMHHPLPFTYPPVAALFAVPAALVGDNLGFFIWTVISLVALLAVVRASTQPLVARFRRPGLALLTVVAVAFVLTPVQDEVGFGQVGIVLMAMCFFDCYSAQPRWPRGLLIGAATAVKLLPGIFIPYLWLSGRRRAAIVAAATAGACTLIALVVLPTDSRTFWTERIFDNSRVGDNTYISNQSLNGMLQRAFGATNGHLLWWVGAAVVAVVGLRGAARASRAGDELRGIAITALVGVIISPVSWIHHLVWLVPVLAVVIGNATDRRRTAWVLGLTALLAMRLPYLGDSIPGAWHIAPIAVIVQDSYGLIAIALLFLALTPPRGVPQPAATVVLPSSSRAPDQTPDRSV